MITLLTGENTFETERTLEKISTSFKGVAEKIDGLDVDSVQLPDLLTGMTLFSQDRLVVIKNLSENKTVWAKLEDWIPKVPSELHLVLVEFKPDKRTKTYKSLQKQATVYESKLWSENDTFQAERWVVEEMKKRGTILDERSAQTLVMRVGVSQWLLAQALEKLAVMESVSPNLIEKIIEPYTVESVFSLFEMALKKKTVEVQRLIRALEVIEDPYRLFGLLSGQAFQLTVLVLTRKDSTEVARGLGVHPFALSKLMPYAKKLKEKDTKKIIDIFTSADSNMKTSTADPWLLIEHALVKMAV